MKRSADSGPLIVFRVDASLQIGSGHVMRCLTLALSLRERGAECQFICRNYPGNYINVIRQRGFVVTTLTRNNNVFTCRGNQEESISSSVGSSSVSDWKIDAEDTLNALGSIKADWLIVDHYNLDKHWELMLSPAYKGLMVIDDLANREHSCDILLDQNLHDNADERYRELVPEHCQLLLGPTHVLLRPEFDKFCNISRSGFVKHVFVYFGSNDRHNQVGKVIDALEIFPTLKADIVLGPNHPHRKFIVSRIGDNPRLKIMDTCDDMARVMASADIGFGVCGVNAWERCAIGLPSIVCITANNQRDDALILARLGAVLNLGDASEIKVADWVNVILTVIDNPPDMIRMGKIAYSLVEGYRRNINELLEMLQK